MRQGVLQPSVGGRCCRRCCASTDACCVGAVLDSCCISFFHHAQTNPLFCLWVPHVLAVFLGHLSPFFSQLDLTAALERSKASGGAAIDAIYLPTTLAPICLAATASHVNLWLPLLLCACVSGPPASHIMLWAMRLLCLQVACILFWCTVFVVGGTTQLPQEQSRWQCMLVSGSKQVL